MYTWLYMYMLFCGVIVLPRRRVLHNVPCYGIYFVLCSLTRRAGRSRLLPGILHFTCKSSNTHTSGLNWYPALYRQIHRLNAHHHAKPDCRLHCQIGLNASSLLAQSYLLIKNSGVGCYCHCVYYANVFASFKKRNVVKYIFCTYEFGLLLYFSAIRFLG